MTQNAYALFWRDYRFGWREMEGKDESMEGIGGKSPPGTPLNIRFLMIANASDSC